VQLGVEAAESLQVRAEALAQLTDSFRDVLPGLAAADIHQLAAYAMAGADGLFIAKEIGGDAVDLIALFELHGRAIYETAVRMALQNGGD
jgi:hypothetical protein